MGIDLDIPGVINIFEGLACYAYSFAGTGLIIFIILAGFRYMAAGGNPERVGAAKKNFGQVLIGAIVILGTSVIISSVAAAVGSSFNAIPFSCL